MRRVGTRDEVACRKNEEISVVHVGGLSSSFANLTNKDIRNTREWFTHNLRREFLAGRFILIFLSAEDLS